MSSFVTVKSFCGEVSPALSLSLPGNGAANGDPVTYVRSKRYVLALKIP